MLSGSGDNIKFAASAPWNKGDTISVNGTAFRAQTTGGEALEDGCFVRDAVVTCCKNGTTLNFKTGGAGLNFKVIAVASESLLPATARENTIAVITETPITEHQLSVSQPTKRVSGESLSTGDIWFSTGVTSNIAFNALKKNAIAIYPTSVKQFISNAWQLIDAKIFQSGTWKNWANVLYENGVAGEKWEAYALSYSTAYFVKASTLTLSSSNMVVSIASSGSQSGSIQLKQDVDFTNISTLRLEYDMTGGYVFFATLPRSSTYVYTGAVAIAQATAGTGQKLQLNTAALSGKYNVAVCVAGTNLTTTATIRYIGE